jgi:hypothetical protein
LRVTTFTGIPIRSIITLIAFSAVNGVMITWIVTLSENTEKFENTGIVTSKESDGRSREVAIKIPELKTGSVLKVSDEEFALLSINDLVCTKGRYTLPIEHSLGGSRVVVNEVERGACN